MPVGARPPSQPQVLETLPRPTRPSPLRLDWGESHGRSRGAWPPRAELVPLRGGLGPAAGRLF